MNRNSASISPPPPAFTRTLTGAKYHGRNTLDVLQNLGRGVEAVVLSPVHLVQQITGNDGQPVRYVRPSRHQQRMRARPEGAKTYGEVHVDEPAREGGRRWFQREDPIEKLMREEDELLSTSPFPGGARKFNNPFLDGPSKPPKG
jgi:hypothetical protein